MPKAKPFNPLSVDTYVYSTSAWGALLTIFNGRAKTYDAIGNPLSYYNGSSYTFTWDGRRLATAVKGTDSMSFSYDDDGIRVSKTVNGVTTHYVYSGSLLISEYTDTESIVYIYDVNGSPIGFRYRLNTYADDVWDTYWYVKSLQGDIIEIYSSAGVKLVTYKYDAWGKTTVAYSNNGANTTAVKNNLTYRGYYYDSDLGLYYLQTRYYDPVICRFISPDSIMSGTNGSLHGFNLYVYCFNNPVSYTDSTGNWPELLENAYEWAEKKWEQLKNKSEKVVKAVTDFVNDILEDYNNYDSNNTLESVTLSANYFSSYKGTFVIITPFDASFSFGFIGLSNIQRNSRTLNHEYGHRVQLDERGWGGYIIDIAIPSVTANILARKGKLTYDYYGSPWEMEADIKGGVTRYTNNTPWPANSYDSYFDLIKMFF